MYRTGHYGAALLAYAPIAAVVVSAGFRTLAFLGAAVTLGLATLPDFDHRLPLVSHRGITHTVWFAIVVGGVVGFLGSVVGASLGPTAETIVGTAGFVVGFVSIASHVAADALTPAGVRPFAPLSSRQFSYSVTTAKNPIANYTLLVVGVFAVAAAVIVGNGIADVLPAVPVGSPVPQVLP
jgi:inner membrane protein